MQSAAVTSATFGQKGKDVIDRRNLLKYSHLGIAVMIDKGLFAKHGLDVDVSTAGGMELGVG
jgi:ABC-type nitrate/sulfonate/bicarbonate transport system substrate-binding protein